MQILMRTIIAAQVTNVAANPKRDCAPDSASLGPDPRQRPASEPIQLGIPRCQTGKPELIWQRFVRQEIPSAIFESCETPDDLSDTSNDHIPTPVAFSLKLVR